MFDYNVGYYDFMDARFCLQNVPSIGKFFLCWPEKKGGGRGRKGGGEGQMPPLAMPLLYTYMI